MLALTPLLTNDTRGHTNERYPNDLFVYNSERRQLQ